MAASAAPANVNSDGANANADFSLPVRGDTIDTISMPQLVAELAKQRAGLKNDVSGLIQESLKPLQTAMDALRDTVGSFQARLAATESIAGENFERLTTAEATIQSLQTQNQTLWDRVDDMENRSRRSDLRIVNIPEGSENGKDQVKFISELLAVGMGPDVFTSPPELERAHRSLAQNQKRGNQQDHSSCAFFEQDTEK